MDVSVDIDNGIEKMKSGGNGEMSRAEINIYNQDCMEGMKGMEDNQFDLAIVDPPYGIGVKINMGRRAGVKNDNPHAKWDNESPSELYFIELMRVSVNQIIWGANYFISKMPIDSKCWLMWDKKFSEHLSFSQYELAWTSFDSVAKKYEKTSNERGRIHPTQKPVALYKWLLQNYAKPGDTPLTHTPRLRLNLHRMLGSKTQPNRL